MKITGIEIEENYNLKHVDISFSKRDNALVVGPNGWGKTNIVRSVTTTIEKALEQQVFNPDQREPAVKSFVKVSFALNKDEMWTILKWRLIFVTERMLKLCDILSRTEFSELQQNFLKVRQFWKDVFPRLLTVLAKSYQSLDEFIDSKTKADVVVSHTEGTSKINFMGLELPDQTDEEFEIITAFIERNFGSSILDNKDVAGIKEEVKEEKDFFQSKRIAEKQSYDKYCYDKSDNSDEDPYDDYVDDGMYDFDEEYYKHKSNQVRSHVDNVLNHSRFLKHAGFRSSDVGIYGGGLCLRYTWLWDWINYHSVPSKEILNAKIMTGSGTRAIDDAGSEQGVNNSQRKRRLEHKEGDMHSLGETMTNDMILKQLQKLDYLNAEPTLGSVIIKFLKEGSVCVLSQNRGNALEEGGVLFWSIEKAEKQIVDAYLSGKDSIRKRRLQKVQEAVLLIANLELDVVKQDGESSNKLYVVFRNSIDAHLRKLNEASGGERELLLVLTAIHLSGTDSVFLDEPGHSLHPPKQAQLRRWFERRKDENQALFLITHAADMVDHCWLDGLYHMYSEDDRYSAASLNAVVPHTNGSGEPRKKNISDDTNKMQLDSKLGDFLMGVEMRRLFFSSGTVFVEGVSDKRVIEALRLVELNRLSLKMKNHDDVSYNDWLRAYWDTQMDQWDIICMDGSTNWLKAYQAASNLKVPFVIVLDADVLNKISGSSIAPITYADWKQSRLRKAVEKDLNDVHPLAKMVNNVDKITEGKTEGCLESSVREELKKHSLWVWQQRDLESALFADEAVKEALLENRSFKEDMQQIGISFENDTSKSDRSQGSMINSQKSIDSCYGKFKTLFDELDAEFQKVKEDDILDDDALAKLQSSISSKAGLVKQDLKNLQNFVKQLKKEEQPKHDDLDANSFFFQVKKKLHNQGCWKSISSDSLQNWITEALRIKDDHPLHLLWEHIREKRIHERESTEVPSHVMKEMIRGKLH